MNLASVDSALVEHLPHHPRASAGIEREKWIQVQELTKELKLITDIILVEMLTSLLR
jgi:hypothetical protein